MKRSLILSTVVVAAVVAFSPDARADHGGWRFNIGIGRGGAHFDVGYRRHDRHDWHHRYRLHRGHHSRRHHRSHHVHVRAPIYRDVWVQPVYSRVLVGHDDCGYPVYRRVVVRHGYNRHEICGYRCNSCGHRF